MKIYGFIIILVLLNSTGLIGQDGYEKIEDGLEKLNRQVDSLTVIDQKSMVVLDSLAIKISELKAEKKLNFFEHRQLENLLKQSQLIVEHRQELRLQISSLQDQRFSLTEQLVQRYSIVIDSLLERADQPAVPISQEERAQLVQEAQRLTDRREHLLTQIPHHKVSAQQTITVLISDDDTPRDIEEKADYLNDREDKLRKQVTAISEKIAEVRNESRLRQRMSELMDDLRLFDQHEEPVSPSQIASALTKAESMGKTYWTNRFQDVANEGSFLATDVNAPPPAINQLLSLDFSDIDPRDLELIIEMLESESRNLIRHADSLATVASQFRKKAQQLREHDAPGRE